MGKTIFFAFLLVPGLAFAQFSDCNSTGPLLEKQITTTLTAGLLRSTGSCVRGAVVNGGLEMVGANLSIIDGDTVGQVLRWTGTDWETRLIIFPTSTGGVDTVYNGLTDRDTAFVLGGPLVEHTRVHGQKAYDLTLDDMRTVLIEAQRTSGVAFSSLTMGSTAVAGIDFAHYNEADAQKQALAAVNYSTGNVLRVQNSTSNGTYLNQYDAGAGLFQTDIYASNGTDAKTIRINRDAIYLMYLEALDITHEAAFVMVDTFTGQLRYKSPADFAGLYGDDWGSQTVVASSPLSGVGTIGSPLVVSDASAVSSGVVNTTAQTMAGLKTFSGGVVGQSTSSFAALDAGGVFDANYVVVTSNTTLDHTHNFVAIGTLSNNRTMSLPACNSTRDGWEYRFLKIGTDIYTVTIDPNGSEAFHDGALTKFFDGQGSGAFCKCRWNGSAGTWFHSQSFAPSQVVYTSTPGTAGQTLRHDGSVWQPTSNLYSGLTGIGIFTASPAQTLHVAGTARITGSDGTATTLMGRDADGDVSAVSINSRLSLSGGALDIANGTTGSFLRSGASVPAWETAASLQGSLLLPSGTSTQTLRHNGSAWVANSTLANDGSFIGIGTTSPSSILDIRRPGNDAFINLTGYDAKIKVGGTLGGNQTYSAQFVLESENAGVREVITEVVPSTRSTALYRYYGAEVTNTYTGYDGVIRCNPGVNPFYQRMWAAGGQFDIGVILRQDGQTFTYTDMAPYMTIRSYGYVGIGQESPAQKLDVNGTVRIVGSSGTATAFMGRDADGDISAIGIGAGFALSGGNAQADIGSGLNFSGNDIAWGGTLTENTTVDFDTYDVFFTNMPTSTTEDEALVIDSGTGKLARGQIPYTALRNPGEATYLGANGGTGETVSWQPEDILVEADPTAGHLTVELNTSMKQGLAYSLFGCCNLTYNITLNSGTMKITGSYGTTTSYVLGAGEHLEVIRMSTNTFYVSKK